MLDVKAPSNDFRGGVQLFPVLVDQAPLPLPTGFLVAKKSFPCREEVQG
jgi:hypothetical protein